MEFIDTHTHLFSDKFEGENAEAVQRAIDSGVKKMFLPNIDWSSVEPMMELVNKFPEHCFPAIGLHPCDVDENYKEVLENMESLLKKNKFYAIGETGLDLYWDKTKLGLQIESLIIQIEWAKEYQLPIIIHARDSYDELFKVFDELNDDRLKGVFHCFTGSKEQADKIVAYGDFYLGIGGVLTYKNAGLDKTLENVNMEYLVLETDSPYLAPHPNRGKRNESSFLHYIATKLAIVKNVSIEEVSRITTENAHKLFNI